MYKFPGVTAGCQSSSKPGVGLEPAQAGERLHGELPHRAERGRVAVPGHGGLQHALLHDLLQLHGALLRRRDGLQRILLRHGHRPLLLRSLRARHGGDGKLQLELSSA